ncbi:MAG: hypothetical protein ACLQOO_14695, partial [Terriglobia bacterium]
MPIQLLWPAEEDYITAGVALRAIVVARRAHSEVELFLHTFSVFSHAVPPGKQSAKALGVIENLTEILPVPPVGGGTLER